MSKTKDKAAVQLAMQAALLARKPTFLARLPRLLKMAALGAVLVATLLPFVLGEEVLPEELPEVPQSVQAGEAPATPIAAGEGAVDLGAADRHAAGGENHERPPFPAFDPSKLTDAQRKAIETNNANARLTQLVAAPDSAVSQQVTGGSVLPVISADGRKPWRVYARPFDALDPRPRVALVLVDMGLSRIASDSALRRLPPNVTFVFDADAPSVKDWLQRARGDGHETVLSVPMEPLDYPQSDPGPNTLLTSLPNADNLGRFFVALKSGSGYIGITSMTASRFATDAAKLQPILEEVKARGLLALDARTGTNALLKDMADRMDIPLAVVARTIDADPAPYAIDAALADIERRAREQGGVVAVASPLPSTLDRLEVWLSRLEKNNIALAPLSAVVQ